MKWTKKRPTGEGFYFLRRKKVRVVEIVRERSDGTELWLYAKGIGPIFSLSPDTEWSGPIPEPEDE